MQIPTLGGPGTCVSLYFSFCKVGMTLPSGLSQGFRTMYTSTPEQGWALGGGQGMEACRGRAHLW